VSGTLTVSGCTLCDNSANGFDFLGLRIHGDGGGIANGATSTLTVRDSVFLGNSADRGGGIWNFGTATVQDSTLCGNTATVGGGIFNDSGTFYLGTLIVRGSTFSDNTASDSGGGLYNLGTVTVQQSTLSGNTAGTGGGGIFNGASGTLTIDDSAVCGNVAPLGADLFNLGVATLNDSTVWVIYS
jgi:predicted outer membrane repeat protein